MGVHILRVVYMLGSFNIKPCKWWKYFHAVCMIKVHRLCVLSNGVSGDSIEQIAYAGEVDCITTLLIRWIILYRSDLHMKTRLGSFHKI